MSVVAIVPARAGSKGIPGKNIRPLCGKPLLAYTAEAIRASGIFEHALLSTDSEEIASIGHASGLETPFLRPAELAHDATPMLSVIEHALDWMDVHRQTPNSCVTPTDAAAAHGGRRGPSRAATPREGLRLGGERSGSATPYVP